MPGPGLSATIVLAMSAITQPRNEAVLSYAPGSPERAGLLDALDDLDSQTRDLPMRIGGKDHRGSGQEFMVRAPHNHEQKLGVARQAGATDVQVAIDAANTAAPDWGAASFDDRAAIFLRAADLLAGPYRQKINASTMLGQSKTIYQAEIDAACELIDFWRWNVYFAARIAEDQPVSPPGFWNRTELRPLEGFVFAITPFNFTSIAGNLATAPAIMGNTVVWKPSSTQQLAATFIMEVLEAAGLPAGVINMVTGGGAAVSEAALVHPALAGIHFTGSTAVFHQLWQGVAGNLDNYKTYPRLVGETGGKDFVLAHASAQTDALRVALIRGAFEYQGQKCSAASRAYVPQSMWQKMKPQLADEVEGIAMGDVTDLRNFMGAVIDERAFTRLDEAIAAGRQDSHLTLVAGGETDRSTGWFIRPTIFETDDPRHELMSRELFGPVLTVYPYPDSEWDEVLQLVDTTSPYALTGAVFADDRKAVDQASSALRHAAGNFYINDKPTGAVVGQQPFGGARASGTNDKAGSSLNLTRWISSRSIKETFVPPTDWRYPHMRSDK
jgi:1-pyrroline-5-carboxylate dehydrogenase